MSESKSGVVRFLLEFSIPLIAGVFAALVWANLDHDGYHHFVELAPFGDGAQIFGHKITLHYLINDVFMVLFFGIAAKEITEACLPGGSLNPPTKAINPLMATIGGVVGPVGVFFVLVSVFHGAGAFGERPIADLQRGWGIPTATDIALAWLVARAVFGKGHPAINYLLLLAVADDAIGLVIIALAYPKHDPEWVWTALLLVAMAVAYGMRMAKVKSWVPYIAIAGPIAWCGLSLAHLHPALALVFVVPFLPGPRRDTGLFVEGDEVDRMGHGTADDLGLDHSPLHEFEHQLKTFVDFGLFFFALANAGVEFSVMGPMTWIILLSLVVGKTLGIAVFGLGAAKLGLPLPDRMGAKQVLMAGFVAALGLTVALFVAGEAFSGPLQSAAKMGALFSGGVGIVAVVLGKALKVREDGS